MLCALGNPTTFLANMATGHVLCGSPAAILVKGLVFKDQRKGESVVDRDAVK